MPDLFTPTHLIWLLSAGFAAAGVTNLFGLYKSRWQYPSGFHKVTGTLLLLAAVLLLFPVARIAGVAIASLVMFLSATTLLHHGRYTVAAPIIALLFALIPVSLGQSL